MTRHGTVARKMLLNAPSVPVRPTMWVQPYRSADLQVVPPKVEGEPSVAVLLNLNARKVTDRVVRALSHVVPQGDLFLSRSEIDCRRIAQTVLDRRYHT